MKTAEHQTVLFKTLACSNCGKTYPAFSVNTFSLCCQQPLVSEYDLSPSLPETVINEKERSLWRYLKVLPVFDRANVVSLGEGWTPVVALNNLAQRYNVASLLLKDEAGNPTGSFKARGLSVAVSKAKELGLDRLIVPTAGNAGGALAAYCAKANLQCTVVMPQHTPEIFKQECRLFGAELIEVKGLLHDCAKKVEALKKQNDFFDVSTLKEPYRLEGKKTMGYEIAEQLAWHLPDVIVYPTGGGTGLIGIWKAFQEMRQLGWLKNSLPRMIAVQTENCAPLQAAVENPSGWKESFVPAASVANGLVVPYPFGMSLMLRVLADSGGDVTTVSEKEILDGIKEVAAAEGILLSPEGSAAWKGWQRLLHEKKINAREKVLLLNTGSGYKYAESLTA